MASKYRVITSRNASESRASPRLVDPLRSEKTIVTTFRVSWGAGASASCEPQARQNRATSGFSVPQLAHVFMRRVYEPPPFACEYVRVGAGAAADHLDHAIALEERDAALARELETVERVAEQAGAIRARATAIRTELDSIPIESAENDARRDEAEQELAGAQAEVGAAEARLAELESARRRKDDDLDRARREAATARDRLADAESHVERLAAREIELCTKERALRDEGEALLAEAARVADEIRRVERVTKAADVDPGATLEEIEEWGARVRSALFVARGTLETERERIVVEASGLGTAVLGESLGGSSVAMIRRRLEERLS